MGNGWMTLEDTPSVHLSENVGFHGNTPPCRENVLRGIKRKTNKK